MNYLFIATLVVLLQQCCSLRILGIIPFTSRSHYINTQPILGELANRGHHVTVISVFEEKNPPPNYEQIVVTKRLFWEFMGEDPDIFALEKISFESMLNLVWDGVHFSTSAAFNSTNLQDFIKNDKSHYDVIFAEVFYQESMYMFAHKYNAPIVGISTNGFTQYLGEAQGNPLVLPYMVHEFLNYGTKLSFSERLFNFYATVYDLFWRKYYHLPKQQKLAEENFKSLPQPLPSVADLEKNISVYLINTHFSYDVVRPYVSGIVEIGGVHIKEPKTLPENIKKFLDDSKDGAIFFSFGSNLKSKDMPKDKINMFLNVFKQLKQRVIWKWETDDLEEIPPNVMIGKWLPQNDILAHPKTRLFITHGGLLSTQETIYHGIPAIGFPFYGDQFLNMGKVQDAGYGIKASFAKITEAELSRHIKDVLFNPKYMIKAKELSRRFKDRPNSALDTAVYWVEYVARHNGAHFMKSPILSMSWFEYHMIDIGALIFAVVVLFIIAVFLLIKFVFSFIGNGSHVKKDKKKNN